MTLSEMGVREVKTFRDKKGRAVREFVDVAGGPSLFSGVARVKVTPLVSEVKPTSFEKDFEFAFTDDVKTVEDAFNKFDEVCEKTLAEMNNKNKVKKADNFGSSTNPSNP